ncbi:hypothetical protein NW768_011210 [Fusarium equiseti]|uniref:Uncharacterized protein n=1 Tax=Fusarium equiseti TaxID=61235 RepID=A0ABQ8QY75_FUSEQ|nr:hypothetical protein NW768_011210 [Fusarium equiseti]
MVRPAYLGAIGWGIPRNRYSDVDEPSQDSFSRVTVRPQIRGATINFEDIAFHSLQDLQPPSYVPRCVRACRVTIDFKKKDAECKKGISYVVWRGTCKENFDKGPEMEKSQVLGCDNYHMFWEGNLSTSGTGGLKRHLVLEKKAYGDYYKFGVYGCDKGPFRHSAVCLPPENTCSGVLVGSRSGG